MKHMKNRVTVDDRCEFRLFEMYLRRRMEKPDEDLPLSYAEVYGAIVYESSPTPIREACTACEGLGKIFTFGHGWLICPVCEGRRHPSQ